MTEEAKNRKNTPIFTGFMMYFPRAIDYVTRVSVKGNEQHHPDEPLHWDMSKSSDEPDAIARHLKDIGKDWDNFDTDGLLHAGKIAWRSLALLERVLLKLEKKDTVMVDTLEDATIDLADFGKLGTAMNNFAKATYECPSVFIEEDEDE